MRNLLPELTRESPVDLIWIETGFIGDVVLASGAMSLAKQHFSNLRQYVVTTPVGAKVLAGCSYLDGVVTFDKRGQSALAAFAGVRHSLMRLRETSPSSTLRAAITMVPHRSYRSAFLSHYLGLPRVVYDESPVSFGAAARVKRVAVFHEAVRVALLLEPLGIGREMIAEAMPSLAESRQSGVADLLKSPPAGGWLGMAPGSVWGTKRWPRQGFVRAAQWAMAKHGCGIVLIGSENEANICKSIEAALLDGSTFAAGESVPIPVLNLAGKTSIDDLKGIFPRLRTVLSNDSSPVHFASAFGVPTVAVFGATIPAMGFGPLAAGSETVGIDLSCRPCSDHGPKTCPLGHFRCMKELKPDSVIAALDRILAVH